MKVKIYYEYDPQYPDVRFAYVKKGDDRKLYVGGDTWEEAKNQLVSDLKAEQIVPPEPEEVEI